MAKCKIRKNSLVTEPRVSFNHGFHDGIFDQKHEHKMPMWAKEVGAKHPLDASYGKGYWMGWGWDMTDPDWNGSSDEAWNVTY